MNTRKINPRLPFVNHPFSFGLLLTYLIFLTSCKQDLSDDAIPQGFFADILLNLNAPENIALKNSGGSIQNNGGVRGIIVYRNGSNYLAYERNCSYHPNDACATIEVHSSNLYMIDTCCGSSFGLDDGIPTGGPAWRPLRQYRTFLDGSTLTITSDSANGM
jgi:nitrite reductase/ring-hydroxylating ferredoxin subunit